VKSLGKGAVGSVTWQVTGPYILYYIRPKVQFSESVVFHGFEKKQVDILY
jgi:hypothetical protein